MNDIITRSALFIAVVNVLLTLLAFTLIFTSHRMEGLLVLVLSPISLSIQSLLAVATIYHLKQREQPLVDDLVAEN